MNAKDVVERLATDGFRLAVAESCTGGLLGAALTDVPGASKTFVGGILAYQDEMKTRHLDVDPQLFVDGHGAVSATVAESMAESVRTRFGADIGIGVSGIAGPTGGSKEKPVGTVWLSCVGPGDLVNVHRIQVAGDRRSVRHAAVEGALDLLARNLEEAEAEAQRRLSQRQAP